MITKSKFKLKKIYTFVILLITIFIIMMIRFKISQPDSPIFRYNGSIFSVSNNIYEVSSQNEIWKANALGKSINKNSLKYLYKFNLNRELESYMVANYSQIYCINEKPLKGKLSDIVLIEFEDDIEYRGKVYKKGKFYIANRIT